MYNKRPAHRTFRTWITKLVRATASVALWKLRYCGNLHFENTPWAKRLDSKKKLKKLISPESSSNDFVLAGPARQKKRGPATPNTQSPGLREKTWRGGGGVDFPTGNLGPRNIIQKRVCCARPLLNPESGPKFPPGGYPKNQAVHSQALRGEQMYPPLSGEAGRDASKQTIWAMNLFFGQKNGNHWNNAEKWGNLGKMRQIVLGNLRF